MTEHALDHHGSLGQAVNGLLFHVNSANRGPVNRFI